MIAFVGSVFSPYYAWARRRGPTDPEAHVSINVALYGPGGRWAMTERGRGALRRSGDLFQVGPSALSWDGDGLRIDLDEIAVPIPRRVRGTIRLHGAALGNLWVALDPDGRHLWRPILPHARISVEMEAPRLTWSGAGYFDHNIGTEPLEAGFTSWSWSRAAMATGAGVFYDVVRRDGSESHLALAFDREGRASESTSPVPVRLPRTLWGIARPTRSETGEARVVRTLEDTPFYARSLIETRIDGQPAIAFHESLSLDRFKRGIVQAMLPFRMPRRAGPRP